MNATKTSPFQHEILAEDKNEQVTTLLQRNLVNLIDLALQLKQAHWNVIGANFRSIHLQLDEIIATVRDASDEVAERMSALGVAPDGRSSTVASDTTLEAYPTEFVQVTHTVDLVAKAMANVIGELREAIAELGELDPISEDMLIAISGPLEKHLWMVQAQRPE